MVAAAQQANRMSERPPLPLSVRSHRDTRGLEVTVPKPSYPTRCLRHLRGLDIAPRASDTGQEAKVKLNIAISGAGLGGLASAIALRRRGHSVTVYEQVVELKEVGAGIQIPPNSSRLLLKWGVKFGNTVVQPCDINFRRWENGKIIGLTKLVPDFSRSFDAPYYVIHRSDFHKAMAQQARDLGVVIECGKRVTDYDLEAPSLTMEDGNVYKADLIVAADGVRSLAREKILGDDNILPRPTGFAAYRATIDTHRMRDDPEVAWILKEPALNLWIGPDRHVMTYGVANGERFNMVLSHPEHRDPSTWPIADRHADCADMRRHFAEWDPRLTKIIDMITDTKKWPLLSGARLPRWTARSGKAVMLGDAAHAMLPYMSQGAAMAVEDAAALAELLSRLDPDSPEPVPKQLSRVLKVFEGVRIARAGQMQDASVLNGTIWHYEDGPEQQARDEAMRPEVEGRFFRESPNQWSDPVTQEWCYAYDAEVAAAEAWETRILASRL
ncbi:hypothetical protein BDY21DRAFT_388240 [Lineolata rhizophorae]|uniref:FAD-binding domain-containing protein n=1 Tax=Lineolata rhizophorae TaxID=578093 RepID=A0A6A6NN67_9PEZI|nr:hypothetical protein BDY21DRAFT_388240 [Lineolata rhizophorae]